MTEGPGTDAERVQGATPRERSLRLLGDVRARIIAGYVILLLISGLATVFVVREALLARLDERVDDALAQEVEEFRRLAGGIDPRTGEPFGQDVNRIFEVFLSRNVPSGDELLVTVPQRGAVGFRGAENPVGRPDPELIAAWRRLRDTARGEIETGAGPARYLALPVTRQDGRPVGTFAVLYYLTNERDEVNEAIRIIGIVGLAVLVGGGLAAFLMVGRIIAPIGELRDAARSVSGADMTKRIDVRGNDELAALGRTFNGMLDRLELALSTQREFIRDAGHELRTPIAIVRGHLELLAEEDGDRDPQRAETYVLLHTELDRMTRFVNDMLLLAKAERPDFLHLETVELGELGDELLAKAATLGDRNWTIAERADASIVADRHRLTQAVVNLAGNAVAATTPADTIEIGSRIEGSDALLWVGDDGLGIDPREREELLKPFRRGRGARYEGSGLGLAIVSAIAAAHGGSASIEGDVGVGTTVTLRLPIEGPEAPEGDEPRP